ncbi:MAG TPA: DUF1697 domain-containing protein [Vicinamibacterales bacterium]|nr:DUF1697 domain-containing protein [Vicinamibacterales bacterium]
MRHVALLRGINVGKAKRVAMADLRQIVAELGCQDVRTLLNSGNVVFSAPGQRAGQLAARIEAAIAARLRVTSRVTVLTARELRTIVAEQPFGEMVTDPSRCLVAVPSSSAWLRKLEPLAAARWPSEAFGLGSRAAYIWCPGGVLESEALEQLARLLRDEVTTRNWGTTLKLGAMV